TAWSRSGAGQPDGALLPPDPRSLIQPGVNAGKAVYFNAYFKNCHVNAGPEDAASTTCGEWRERIQRGAVLMEGNGAIGAGSLVAGDSPNTPLAGGFSRNPGAIRASDYNDLWRRW